MYGPAAPSPSPSPRLDETGRRRARLNEQWHERSARRRSDSPARALIDHLSGAPILSVETVGALLGKSYETARAAVASLREDGVLATLVIAVERHALSTAVPELGTITQAVELATV